MKRLRELVRQGTASADEAYAARLLGEVPLVSDSGFDERAVERGLAALRARATRRSPPRRPLVLALAGAFAVVLVLLLSSSVVAAAARRLLDSFWLAWVSAPAAPPAPAVSSRPRPEVRAQPPQPAQPVLAGSGGPAPIAVEPATGPDTSVASPASPSRPSARSRRPQGEPTLASTPPVSAIRAAPSAVAGKLPLDDDEPAVPAAPAPAHRSGPAFDGSYFPGHGSYARGSSAGRDQGSLVYGALEALQHQQDPATALARASDYLRRFPDGDFAEQAQFIVLSAEARLDPARARAAAADYLRRYPAGRYRAAALRVQSSTN